MTLPPASRALHQPQRGIARAEAHGGLAQHTIDEIVSGYAWPEQIREGWLEGIRSLDFDTEALVRVLRARVTGDFLAVTFVSREYLPLAKLWITYARNAGVTDVVVAAVDDESAEAMASLNVASFRVRLPQFIVGSQHVNAGGFCRVGLAIVASRLFVLEFLAAEGCNAMQVDVDALFLGNPSKHVNPRSHLAFQRVVYFPKAAVRAWGFAACGGFIAYRASPQVQAFLQTATSAIRLASSDQIAINLALLHMGAEWDRRSNAVCDATDLRRSFLAEAEAPIMGRTQTGLVVEALPATTFWRHRFVPLHRDACVLLHPNSEKDAEAKMQTFQELLGESCRVRL